MSFSAEGAGGVHQKQGELEEDYLEKLHSTCCCTQNNLILWLSLLYSAQ